MDLNGIVDRNKIHLEKMLSFFHITVSMEHLLDNFTRVYIHQDAKMSRIRLMGFEKEEGAVIEEGKKKEKTKRVQLFTLNKRDLESYSEEAIESIKLDLTLVVALYREILLARELLDAEIKLGEIIQKRKLDMKK